MNGQNFPQSTSEWAAGQDIEQLAKRGMRLHDQAIFESCARLVKSLWNLRTGLPESAPRAHRAKQHSPRC